MALVEGDHLLVQALAVVLVLLAQSAQLGLQPLHLGHRPRLPQRKGEQRHQHGGGERNLARGIQSEASNR